ncbi:MAG: cation-translocating P-type ATPase [Verrucomicrobiota bacterium]
MSATAPETTRADANAPATRSEFSITGMTCGNCARHVTEAIQSVPGVLTASVSLDAGRASVRWKPGETANPGAVTQAVAAEGYGAKPVDPNIDSAYNRQAGWRMNLWIGLAGTLPLMIGEWVFRFGMEPWYRWTSFALAAVVQVFAGAPFYRGAWNRLKTGGSNMDTLVALGSTTAFAYSAWTLFADPHRHLYFMESAAIITLISVGHFIEARIGARASGALRQLLDLAPRIARRKLPDGTTADVPVGELVAGDEILLSPGDHVPTDGLVLEGASAVDESMLTGESVPVDKAPGSRVFAGTAAINGRLAVRVTATGDATALAHVITAVQRAQNSRASIQRIGDAVSNVFVPIVVAIALLAALGWGFAPEFMGRIHAGLSGWLWHAAAPEPGWAGACIVAAAVLIVACPCAMGLATPAAIMAAANAAAARGILIRDGVALEKAGRISSIVFDKTGTLTEGRPKVAAREAFPRAVPEAGGEAGILRLGASLAALSRYPLSQAVAETTADRVTLQDFREYPALGIRALAGSGAAGTLLVQLGSPRWFAEESIDFKPAEAFARHWMNQGSSVIGLAIEGRLAAVYALKDPLKPGAAEVVRTLSSGSARLKVHLMSGDARPTVEAIARELGLDRLPGAAVHAEVPPDRKSALVADLQKSGDRVAFVGDGINDAPALEQADLGIAVSRASDIAREAADLILLKSDIEAVPEALGLARAALRTIRQNLFWAFFYNALGIPLAALGFMSPVLCAAAMGFSDIIVIGNALRLYRSHRRG